MAENRPRPTRPSQTGQGGPKGGVRPGDVERAFALRDVMDHAVKVHKEITGPSKFKGSSGRAVAATIVCVPLLAFCVYSFVGRPEFIWGSAGKPLPPAQQEAGIRFGMFLLAQRVEAYRVAYGGYPPSLTAVGDSLEGVSYAVVSDAVFELRATNNGKPIVFRSNESADAFLGNSTNIIQGLSR